MIFKHLDYIPVLVEEGSFTKAAAKLGISQSTLSKYVQRLETELDAKLFVRRKGRLLLTPQGRIYVDAAQKAVTAYKDALKNIRIVSKDQLSS